MLAAAEERASVATMLSGLHLVSLTPERAVVGHSPRDRMTAEMALGHLSQLFERILGRKVAVSIMQVKDAATAPATPAALSEPRGGASGSGPSAPPAPAPPQRAPAPSLTARPAPAASPAPEPPPQRAIQAPTRALSPAEIDAAKAHPLVIRAGELLNAKVVRINARPDAPRPNQPPPS